MDILRHHHRRLALDSGARPAGDEGRTTAGVVHAASAARGDGAGEACAPGSDAALASPPASARARDLEAWARGIEGSARLQAVLDASLTHSAGFTLRQVSFDLQAASAGKGHVALLRTAASRCGDFLQAAAQPYPRLQIAMNNVESLYIAAAMTNILTAARVRYLCVSLVDSRFPADLAGRWRGLSQRPWWDHQAIAEDDDEAPPAAWASAARRSHLASLLASARHWLQSQPDALHLNVYRSSQALAAAWRHGTCPPAQVVFDFDDGRVRPVHPSIANAVAGRDQAGVFVVQHDRDRCATLRRRPGSAPARALAAPPAEQLAAGWGMRPRRQLAEMLTQDQCARLSWFDCPAARLGELCRAAGAEAGVFALRDDGEGVADPAWRQRCLATQLDEIMAQAALAWPP